MLVIRNIVKRLWRSERGNVAVTFGLLALPLIMVGGLAIDYTRMTSAQTRLDKAADSAALAAVAQNAGTSPTLATRKSTGEQTFVQNATVGSNATYTYSVVVTQANLTLTAKATYTATVPLIFGNLIGMASTTISGASSATSSLPPYIDVYLMIDTSGSMALGASQADIDQLMSKTGCAFACHDGSSSYWVNGKWTDSYGYAIANNISLRFQIVNQGIQNLIQVATQSNSPTPKIRLALYGFDVNLNQLATITYNFTQIQNNYPSTPSSSGESDGATHFNENITAMLNAVGTGGDGSTQATAKKLLIIATDGVQDPGRFWTWNLPYRAQVDVLDTSFCKTAASKNVSVGFVHTPYLPMAWDWGYNATLGMPSQHGGSGTRDDDVEPMLRACAGNLYLKASDTQGIKDAFVKIFQNFSSPRITN